MKYKELNINEKLFGKNYLIYDWVESDEKIDIYIKSKSHTATCPNCKKVSSFFHATYIRKIQMVPIHLKTTYVHVNAYKYKCLNDECETKVFMEKLDFASPSQVRTTELNLLILAVSIFLSNEGASNILSLIGVKVSNDTIKRIYDKIIIDDEPDIETVGIDDVAIKKGNTYATAIYDLNSHHLIALLDGRDAQTLKNWLKNHKKIKLVARDRASAYAKAINEILPECTQVADRFHLLQNLIQRIRDIFKVTLPKEIFIKNGHILTDTPRQVNILKIDPLSEKLATYSYNNNPPIDENGLIIEYDNKKRNFDTAQYKRQAEGRKIKQQFIYSLQSRWREIQPQSIKLIANEFNICNFTAQKYIKMSVEDIELLNQPVEYKKRKTVVDEYLNIIYKMLADKINPAIILSYIVRLGYTGNLGTLISYITLIAKNNFEQKLQMNWAYTKVLPEKITFVKRNEVLSYILQNTLKKHEKIKKHIDIIKKEYGIIDMLEQAYCSFYTVLMGKDPCQLKVFIDKYKSSPIKSFIDGIKKDIAPVKNAISHNASSGFVEGNNNKFKLIKRILYGRANLVNLFKKCYIAFRANRKDFILKDLIKTNALY